MSKLTFIARILLGLVFIQGGVLFFLMTPPEMPPGAIADFFKGLAGTKYFFYLLKFTEITCGLMLLSGLFVPLALVVLAPIILNIFFVHVFLAPEAFALTQAVVIGLLEIYLAFFSREYSPTIKMLFRKK